MRIGYACLAIAVPGSEMKSCILKNADEQRLLSLIEHNLCSLEKLIDYNIRSGIRLFRISSDLIPFGSSAAAELNWHERYADKLTVIGKKILDAGMRVSMHPGQYTVLNSPDKLVFERSVEDLRYHAKVLDALGLGSEHKLVLHAGGAYGNKTHAKERFISRFRDLEPSVRDRLVLENDDALFHIGDVLEISDAAGIPAVFDILHHLVNPADKTGTDSDWIRRCRATWKRSDGPQKIHYSGQHPKKKPGAHSDSIEIDAFLEFYDRLEGQEIDVVLEVKDKNLSALKCIHCVLNRGMDALQAEWERYQYLILERSPKTFGKICELLRDKNTYPAIEMYRMIEAALGMPAESRDAVNAARQVWASLEDKASETEKKRFERLLIKLSSGEPALKSVKNNLLLLAAKYQRHDLLNGYYCYK